MVNRRRRVFIAVGVVGVVVAFVAVLPFLLNPVALVNRNLSRIEKIASEKLGRKFSVAHVEGRVFPSLAVTVTGVELSSDTAGEPAMLLLPELELRFRLDKALLSLGNTLELEEVTIRDGVLRVRRDVHGGLDVFDVLQKLPPFDPKDIEGGVLSLLSVSNGRVELYDEDSGVEVAVHKVKMFVRDAGPGRPLDGLVTADWDGPAASMKLDLHVDRLPMDLAFWPLPASRARFDARGLEIAKLSDVFAWPPVFDSGVVDVGVDWASDGEGLCDVALKLHGREVAPSLAPLPNGAGTEKVVADLSARVVYDIDSGATDVKEVEFVGAGVAIKGAMTMRHPVVEEIETLSLGITVTDLGRAVDLIPVLRDVDKKALKLDGNGVGRLEVTPENVDLVLNLDGAGVAVGQAVKKKSGEHLNLRAHGLRDGRFAAADAAASASAGASDDDADDVAKERLNRIDADVVAEFPRGVKLFGSLILQPGGVDVVALNVRSNTVKLEHAVALSPLLRDALSGTVKGGKVAVGVDGRIGVDDSAWAFHLKGTDLELAQQNTTASGGAVVDVSVKTRGKPGDPRFAHEGGLDVGVTAVLDDLWLRTTSDDPGEQGALLFEKKRGADLVVDAAVHELGGPGTLTRSLEDAGDPGAVFDDKGLTTRWRRILLGLTGTARVRSARVSLWKAPLDDVDVRLVLTNGGRIRLSPATFRLFGGSASLAGSVVDGSLRPPSGTLVLTLSDLALAQLLAPLKAATGNVEGTLSAKGELKAGGLTLEALLSSLDGPITFTTRGARFGAVDVVSDIVNDSLGFIGGIPGVDKAAVDAVASKSLSASVKDASFTVHFVKGSFRADEPVVVDTRFGPLTLTGHVGLDTKLEMRARLDVAPATLTSLQVAAKELPVECRVVGTLLDPKVENVNVDALVAALQAAARRAVDDAVAPARKSAAELQRSVNKEVDRAMKSVDDTLGKKQGSNATSKGHVGP